MIYLAAYLGLRWSEVAGLRGGRVDLRRATVSVAETNAYVGGFADVKSRSARRTITLPRSSPRCSPPTSPAETSASPTPPS
jgi:integrase